MKRLYAALICLLLLPFGVAVADEGTEVLTPEMAVQLKSVGSVVMSPDGEQIVYSLTIPRSLEEKSGSSRREYRIINADGSGDRLFVSNDGGPSSGTFSPDGKWFTFLASRDGKRQVWALPLRGGEARALTHSPDSISSYQWSRDGSHLAWLARDDYSEEVKAMREKGRDVELVEENYRFTRLHVMNMETGEVQVVTPDTYQVWSFDWHPDGTSFLITTTEEATTDYRYMFQRIYTIGIEGGERQELVKTEGKLGTPVWSPDGSMVAWAGAVDISDPTSGSLFVYSLATGEKQNLTGDREETTGQVLWLDEQTIGYSVSAFQNTLFYSIKADGSERKQILGAGPIFRGLSFNDNKTAFAVSANTPVHPNELFVGTMDGELKKLTDHNPHLADLKLGRQEVIEWEASDGWKIQGVLIYPVDYQEGIRYPLVVNPHGGPESTDFNGWYGYYSKWGQILAGKGYAVFMPNYRASAGRGVAFAKANHQDLGGREFVDVVDGVKYLVEKGLVDENRVGMGGGSYGGYFSAQAATQYSQHFAAAVVFAGPTSQYSKIGTTDTTWENAYVHYDLPDWWNHAEKIRTFSPVAYIENAGTPTLIAHGENDRRVPLGQARELHRHLKAATDVPVSFVIYPRAGHGLGEIQHQIDYCLRAMEWFDTYVKNKEVDSEDLD